MKQIKDYLQLAIDNGYYAEHTFKELKIVKDVKFVYDEGNEMEPESYSECKGLYILNFIADVGTGYKNITDVITSKPFIEAIARGVLETDFEGKKELLLEVINIITTKQAIAIRDNKLEEFINNLLPKN